MAFSGGNLLQDFEAVAIFLLTVALFVNEVALIVNAVAIFLLAVALFVNEVALIVNAVAIFLLAVAIYLTAVGSFLTAVKIFLNGVKRFPFMVFLLLNYIESNSLYLAKFGATGSKD